MKLVSFALTSVSMLSATHSHAQDNVFQDVFGRCLSEAKASVFGCAESAAKAAETTRIEVTREVIHDDAGRPSTRNHVESCSNDGYDICDHYSCSEDSDESICEFIGTTCGEYWC